MNLPIPTDSLWKHLMISSLVGLIALNVFAITLRKDFIQAFYDHETNEKNRSYSTQDLDHYIGELDQLLKKRNGEISKEKIWELKTRINELKAQINSDAKLSKDTSNRISSTKFEEDFKKKYWMYSALFLSLFIFGAFMWYFRIQRFEDKRIKPEIEVLELELKQKNNKSNKTCEETS